MTGLPEVIGLLHRADWALLSLSAQVRFEKDGDLARRRAEAMRADVMRQFGFRPGAWGNPSADEGPGNEPGGYHRWDAALLIAPGRRYRLEYGGEYGGRVEGCDGEQDWTLEPPEPVTPPSLEPRSGPGLPVPALFCPSGLLAGFTLEVHGPATAGGRDAIAVTATPRHDAVGSTMRLWARADGPVELLVDAETGILLRREETFEGQMLTIAELTTITMSLPEADDPARFAPPAGSRTSRDDQEDSGPSGLGWEVAKNAASLAAGGLGAWLRMAPHLPGHDSADDDRFQATMPSPEPGPLGPGDGSPPPGDLLGLLYRSGVYDGTEPAVRDVVMRHWKDAAPVLAQVRGTFRAAGHGGFGYLLDTVGRKGTVSLTTTRLRVGGPDLYRVDYVSQPNRAGPVTVACDGEQRWQVYESVTLVGPPGPLSNGLIGSSWLLGERLSGGEEITYHGRRGYHLRVTRGDGALTAGPTTYFPCDAIVDAETGCLLRLIAYDGDVPAEWWELDHITAERGDTADPAAFRPHIPPGTRVAESVNPVADLAAVTPGLTGTAARAATQAVRRTAGAVSAARSFLDDLRRPHP